MVLKIRIQKIYAWSLVIEPMVFFTLTDQSITAVGANLSRMLSMIVLLFLSLSLIFGKTHLYIPRPSSYKFFFLTLYFYLSIVSGLFGLLMGVYTVGTNSLAPDDSFMVILINSTYIRPVFEYIILLYYIFYFSVLPMVLFKNKEDILYFFKVFFFMFNISLVIGIIDLIFVKLYDTTITGRCIYEWYIASGPRNVGFRFHGIFGEPRDAFVVLGLGAAFYYFKSYVLNFPQNKFYYILILVCALLTQSASGIIGIAIFIGLYITIQYLESKTFSIKRLLLIIFVGIICYVTVINSYRIHMILTNTLSQIIAAYKSGTKLTFPNLPPNIYPLFWIVDNILDLNPIPLLFGGGLGSASCVNNMYSGVSGLTNPHANIIRVLAETGIIGLLIYITAFYYPVKKLAVKLPVKDRNKVIFFALLILSLSLAHRSAANFIFLGIFFATIKVFKSNDNCS